MYRELLICDRIKITLYSLLYGFASFFSVQDDSFMVAEMVLCVSLWFPFGGTLGCPGVYLCDTDGPDVYLVCSSFLHPIHGFGETWLISLGEGGGSCGVCKRRREEKEEEHRGMVFGQRPEILGCQTSSFLLLPAGNRA